MSDAEQETAMEHSTCQQADREFSRTTCGHPLPCPQHTVILDTADGTIRNAPKGNSGEALTAIRRLSDIMLALRTGDSDGD